MRIRNLVIYPIKGLPGLEIEKATIDHTGFVGDRRYMLVDESNQFISQREFHELTRFRMEKKDSAFRVTHSERHNVSLSVADLKPGDPIKVRVWDDEVEGLNMGREAADFFSDILGVKCSLVWMQNPSARPRLIGEYHEKVNVSFADSSPYLVISDLSMAEIERRAGRDLEWIRFRPNIVFEAELAFAEDHLSKFGNEEYQFTYLKKCGRCQVPNLDPRTGEMSKEPLRTLNEFRKEGNNVYFGSYFFSNNIGKEVCLGDRISAIS